LELTISLPDGPQRVAMLGAGERNLKMLREALGVRMSARDDAVRLSGDSRSVSQAAEVLEQLSNQAKRQSPMDRHEVLDAIAAASKRDRRAPLPGESPQTEAPIRAAALDVYLRGRTIEPVTDGQRDYVQAILDHDLTFCIGPAGTGKTYLAVAASVAMLKRGQVRRLALVRPAVEAGEKLGFLPGDMQQKVNPYLRPLLDSLHDMMDYEQIQRLMAADVIEVIPLAFMRGRTLNDTAVILDEAQNTTQKQMMMFLTRMGHGSKMVVTGDTTQTDLEDPRDSGLIDAVRRLKRVRGAAFVTLAKRDIVRHDLVQRIIAAYDRSDPQAQDRT